MQKLLQVIIRSEQQGDNNRLRLFGLKKWLTAKFFRENLVGSFCRVFGAPAESGAKISESASDNGVNPVTFTRFARNTRCFRSRNQGDLVGRNFFCFENQAK